MKQKIEKLKKFHSIRFSLTSVVALLILLSVFISSTLSYSRYTRDFQEQSSEQIDQTLEQLSINLSTYLDELFRLTVYLYYDDSVVAALEATGGSDIDRLQRRRVIESYLDKIMIMPRKDILNVFVITDDIYFSGRMPKSVNHSADYQALDWYQEAMSTQSPIFVPPHTEQLVSYPKDTVFSIVKQLKSVQNIDQVIGVIKVDASYSGIADIARKVNMGEQGGVFIIDNDKNLIYNSASQEQVELLSGVALASSGSWIEKIGSAEYMVNTVQVKSADWTIVAVNSLDELTKNAQKTRDFTFLLATLSSLSAILVLLIFTHSFLKPLMGIVQLMKEVRKGNFQVSFSSKRNDEIGYLGDSFNAMVKTINDNIEKNTELAKKVYEAEMLHTEAQLHALQSQIKPHFLYNTLNMISMQIQVGRLEQAVDNIEKLHRLLRGMAKWDREVLVEDEFAILDAYLGIQSSRFEQRLSYELKLDDSLKKQYILAFILQPLVENAVIHGCETQRRRTKITVEGFLKEGRCYFVVSDDGKGMTEEQLKALREKLGRTAENENQSVSPGADGHIGLENVNKRIQIHYGSCYGIRISSQPDAGTTCRVELPLLEKECKQDVPSITG